MKKTIISEINDISEDCLSNNKTEWVKLIVDQTEKSESGLKSDRSHVVQVGS